MENSVAQMKAGNDVIMPGNPEQTAQIMAAVEDGRLSEDELNRNVEHVLTVVLLSPTFKEYAYSNQPSLEEDAGIVRRAAWSCPDLIPETYPPRPDFHVLLPGSELKS